MDWLNAARLWVLHNLGGMQNQTPPIGSDGFPMPTPHGRMMLGVYHGGSSTAGPGTGPDEYSMDMEGPHANEMAQFRLDNLRKYGMDQVTPGSAADQYMDPAMQQTIGDEMARKMKQRALYAPGTLR